VRTVPTDTYGALRVFGHEACIWVDMETLSVYADVLKIAAETVGGSGNLAGRLGVRPDELARWMSGRQAAPLEPFLRALDLIEGSAS
jgi:hypothetical protein